jgi:endoglycosylceramidase
VLSLSSEAPYAQAVAGTPISSTFQSAGRVYQFVYRPSPQLRAPTTIYTAAAEQYPGGYCATVSGGAITSVPGAAHLLANAADGVDHVVVTIEAGGCGSSSSAAPASPPPASTTAPGPVAPS